jgi:hypothetical protein
VQCCFLAGLIRRLRWEQYVPPKRRLTLNWLNGVVAQLREPQIYLQILNFINHALMYSDFSMVFENDNKLIRKSVRYAGNPYRTVSETITAELFLLGFHLLQAAKHCSNDQIAAAFVRIFSRRFAREVDRYRISTRW